MWAAPREEHSKLFIGSMVVLIGLAWFMLWFWGRTPSGLFYGHHGGLHTFEGSSAFVIVFVAGWTVMIVAMMLPTSLPLISLFRTFVRRRPDRGLLVVLLVVGYLAVWALFGFVVYFGGWILSEAIERSAWLEANVWALGAGVLLLAGIYQFTPLKYHCLEKCRSPLSFITEHWRGSRERSQTFLLGAHHGLFCVGCCWSLMLLMFLVGGAGSLGWMLVLGAMMATEKNVRWGRKIGAPLGVALVGLGLIVGAMPALQSPDGTRIPLISTKNSGINGAAIFTDTPGGVEVRLKVWGLPEPRTTYLAHIHPGSCAGEEHASGHQHNNSDGHAHNHHSSAGEIEHPLNPIVSSPKGSGSSATVLKGIKVADLFSGEGFYVNVHAETSGSEELPDDIACGDLRRSG